MGEQKGGRHGIEAGEIICHLPTSRAARNLPGISIVVTRFIRATGVCITNRRSLVVAGRVSITVIVTTATVTAIFPAVTIFPARRVAVDATTVAIVITVITAAIVPVVAVAIITATVTVRVVAAVAGIVVVATKVTPVRTTTTPVIKAITPTGTATEVCYRQC
jgi:hypothetical protein